MTAGLRTPIANAVAASPAATADRATTVAELPAQRAGDHDEAPLVLVAVETATEPGGWAPARETIHCLPQLDQAGLDSLVHALGSAELACAGDAVTAVRVSAAPRGAVGAGLFAYRVFTPEVYGR